MNQGVRPSNSRSAKHDIFRSSQDIVGNSRNEGNLGSSKFSVKREIDQRVWPHFSLCTREMGGARVSNNATCRRTHCRILIPRRPMFEPPCSSRAEYRPAGFSRGSLQGLCRKSRKASFPGS